MKTLTNYLNDNAARFIKLNEPGIFRSLIMYSTFEVRKKNHFEFSASIFKRHKLAFTTDIVIAHL
jgi:hypothetical protein